MTVAYATTAQLTEFIAGRTPPDDAARLLQRASELVDDIVCQPYSFDATTKIPTDPEIAEAFQKTACAIVELWMEVGESNDIDGLAGTDVAVSGFTGKRAPERSRRAVRPLTALGLHQPYTGPQAGIYPGGRW